LSRALESLPRFGSRDGVGRSIDLLDEVGIPGEITSENVAAGVSVPLSRALGPGIVSD
jgi:hypothetical protein